MSSRTGMIRATLLAVAVAVAVLWAGAAGAADPGDVDERAALAFVDVAVVSMDAPAAVANQTVVVVGNRIARVGNSADVAVPDRATRVDGRGRFLLPGLWDMHAHVGMGDDGTAPGERAELLLYLANGVTGLRNAVGGPQTLALARGIERRERWGPQLRSASPLLEGERAVWPFAVVVRSEDEARAAVRRFADQGYDLIKIYHTLSADTYRAVMDEARSAGVRVMGHVPFEIGVEQVLADGMASIEHFRGYDIDGLSLEVLEIDGGRSAERFGSWLAMTDARMDALVAATVRAGTWNCPTFVVNAMLTRAEELEHMAEHPGAAYMPPELLARFRNSGLLEIFSPESRAMLGRARPQQFALLRKLQRAGAGLLAGTDTFPSLVPGFTLIDELATLVEAGLTPFEALRTATVAPAEFFGEADRRGRIRAGMAADLVLLRADPLRDVRHLWEQEGVVVAGRWLPHDRLLEMLRELVARGT